MKKAVGTLFILVVVLSGFAGMIKTFPFAKAQYTPHGPIHIYGNEDFAAQAANESWPGDGTEGNPYVIEAYEINASVDNGINIGWTNDHFIIRDTRIFDGLKSNTGHNDGIFLLNAPNGKIENCAIENNRVGIYLHGANQIKIVGNTFISNNHQDIIMQDANSINISGNTFGKNGIYILGDWLEDVNTHDIDSSNTVNGKPLYYLKNRNNGPVPQGGGQVILANCTNMTVENLNIRNTSKAIQLAFSSYNTILNNTIDSNSDGIFFLKSTNNIITDNYISNNIGGIALEEGSNRNVIYNNLFQDNFYGITIFMSDFNTIKQNNFLENWAGVGLIWDSSGNLIEGNNFINNSECGIELSAVNDNIFLNNVVSGSEYGVRLWQNSSGNRFENNRIENNGYGYYTYYCGNSNIIGNNFSNNENGIASYYSYWDYINNNIISYNPIGIYFNRSDNNTITNNTVTSNDNGIYFSQSDLNNIVGNNISNNKLGMVVEHSNSNIFHHNTISNNGIQINYSESKNTWSDRMAEGNFWSDYNGLDIDGDGVGDTDLPHLGVDYFPLTDSMINKSDEEINELDVTLIFLVFYFTVLIITLIIVVWVHKKRKSKGDSSGGTEGIPPRGL